MDKPLMVLLVEDEPEDCKQFTQYVEKTEVHSGTT